MSYSSSATHKNSQIKIKNKNPTSIIFIHIDLQTILTTRKTYGSWTKKNYLSSLVRCSSRPTIQHSLNKRKRVLKGRHKLLSEDSCRTHWRRQMTTTEQLLKSCRYCISCCAVCSFKLFPELNSTSYQIIEQQVSLAEVPSVHAKDEESLGFTRWRTPLLFVM